MEENENYTHNEKILRFICPICKSEKELSISKSLISEAKTLTTISIQRNEICEHHFQAFIDKNFNIRGYQKVDFEIASGKKLPKGEYFMKVIVIGDCQVGKSAIIKRFVDDNFNEYYVPTIQLRISKKNLNFGETNITLGIWDIGGQVIHMSPYRTNFYEGAQSAIIVVDRTKEKTLYDVEMWYKDTYQSIPKKIPFILVGNKSDLEKDVVIYKKDLENEAKKLGLNCILASAKTGCNIDELFTSLTQKFLESQIM
ncbi:MAG: Rab family GTPase [Promethearchaeota archaeon]